MRSAAQREHASGFSSWVLSLDVRCCQQQVDIGHVLALACPSTGSLSVLERARMQLGICERVLSFVLEKTKKYRKCWARNVQDKYDWTSACSRVFLYLKLAKSASAWLAATHHGRMH